ncbi:ABC transporter ATP-binding protein [Jatrophihabitans sp. DSM 45814]
MDRQTATLTRNDELLSIESLTVRVPGPTGYDIVRDVSLSLRPGDVLGLVGESGSGKTTLALALLGFARPGTEITGSVRIGGTDIIAASDTERRRARGRLVSYVPQDPATALNPAMRIGAQLDEMLAVSRRERRQLDRSRISELLTKVQLPTSEEFLRRYPHQLSGGQLQRVSIAMAVLNKPRLIVFDEPTTGLDVTTQSRVLDTIRDLISSEDAAAIYVTHDLTVVGSIANRVGVMYSGMLVEEARTEAVLSHSAHPYSRRLVLATPSSRQRRELVGIPGTPLSPKHRADGCPFAPRCTYVEQQCLDSIPALVSTGVDHRSRCRRAEFVQGHAEGARPSSALSGRSIWQERRREDRLNEIAPLMSVSGVTASYGTHTVLHDVSLSIGEGECLALVGESGSGKTTLARCVSGIHNDTIDGTLEFRGKPLDWRAKHRRPAELREIQYIFQNPHASLNPRHTIGRIVAQPLKTFDLGGPSGDRRSRVRQLLERVALPPDYEHRYPSQLSGGERQRVAIARALAAQPRLLVCDEITSSLDVSIQASILELLGQLRQDTNLTLLFITHHLGLVRAIADQIVILNRGVVVEHGAAAAILDAPADPYTVELLANTPVMTSARAVS